MQAKTAFCFALKTEMKPLLEKIVVKNTNQSGAGRWFCCEHKKKEFFILHTGVGPQKAETVLREFLVSHVPSNIINLGLCGGLSSKVKIGDIFVVSESVDSDNIHHQCNIENVKIKGFEWSSVKIVTTDRAIVDRATKRDLYQQTNATVVDMECASLARIANKNNISFSALKIVSDFADEKTTTHFSNNIVKAAKRLSRIALKILEKD